MSSLNRSLQLTIIALLAACNGPDDSTSPEPRPLSREETQSLFRAFSPQLQQGASSLNSTTSATAQTIACPRGGSVSASPVRSGNTAVGVRFVHSDCRLEGADGRTWTLNGDPDVRLLIGEIIPPSQNGGELVMTITMAGTLRAEGGGASGRCPIDTKMVLRVSTTAPPQATARYTGTACGERVDETITVTAS